MIGLSEEGKGHQAHVDALSAILLHNSLYKFSIAFYKSKEKAKAPLAMELHPLAFLLMQNARWNKGESRRNG